MEPNAYTDLVDWSRAQFALTAMYHWLFVPLTLGLGLLVAIMETCYYRVRTERWLTLTKFWMKLFGINFAVGVATGIILEFEFGTNWSNYSWFVGDIFGAPLAIEGIAAFFMESTFLALMFFGWKKLSPGAHLASTWLTVTGATLSAWWILVANGWMQNPVGMEFNPDTVRHEMVSFADVALNPVAVAKFIHVVTSSWSLGCVFVVGISCWVTLRRGAEDEVRKIVLRSVRTASAIGLAATLLTAWTGHYSGTLMAKYQPMKLAAVEGLAKGGAGEDLVVAGLVNAGVDWTTASNDEAVDLQLSLPRGLSIMATGEVDGFVPGIRDVLEGYTDADGKAVPSAREKMARGREAVKALSVYRKAKAAGDDATAEAARTALAANVEYFGYGYINDPAELVPNVPLLFYSFRVMVGCGCLFLALFGALTLFSRRIMENRPALWCMCLTLPLAWLASETGWVVTEVGRQPWAIQDMLPNCAAVSALQTGTVQTTFWIFAVLLTVLVAAELCIMYRAIAAGPDTKQKGE